jgi:hypothetical protein
LIFKNPNGKKHFQILPALQIAPEIFAGENTLFKFQGNKRLPNKIPLARIKLK